MTVHSPTPVFVGRERELAALRARLAEARSGVPQTVIVRGPAGIGKTALIERFLAGADDLIALRARGDELESDLTFGIADQLLRMGGDTQHGLLGADALDHVAAGTRILSLLGGLQDSMPVVIVLDDAHWMDPARCARSSSRSGASWPTPSWR